ncbi:DNA internalization-related competence protein ComEC/Rec2 [Macrococcus equipercicus]|uniref:DNA internalization-related competence protein ComEC/Rec2 n=1 Tax=Macrococcus equipercicus TaxID=69967 RepID=A0A9Q9BS94_9STAP|nr:DNA internalization-related competence protein ComEC/Rec2 [Macrococcus equipercicus]UTH12996.1 DNA internalization-related competence protein ComEC/Rec2 [Macrococcus equipercicus]
MWLNSALSALIGILLTESPVSACILVIVLTIHLYVKKQLMFLLMYSAVIAAFLMLSSSGHTVLSDFDWTDNEAGSYKGPVLFEDDVQVDGDLLSGTLTAGEKKLRFNYYIGSEEEQRFIKAHMPYYTRCPVDLRLQRVLPNTNGLKFDYDEYLSFQGIHYTAKVTTFDRTSCQPLKPVGIDWLKKYRLQLADWLMTLPHERMAYVVALTLGDTRYLSTDELTALKALGIYHLYAISGSHVALLSVQLFYVLKRLYVPLLYSRMVILVLIPLYALLTGCSPSVLRASLFIFLYILLKPFGMTLLDSLALSFLLFLLYDIQLIMDIGFQLSYIISFVLIFTGRLFDGKPAPAVFIMTTFFAQMASLPVLLLHFNTIQWSGFITNLLFVPFFTFLLFPLCTLILLAAMFFHVVPSVLLDMLTVLFKINDALIALFNGLHLPETVISNQWAVFYIMIAAVVCYGIYCCYRSTSAGLSVMASLCLLLMCWPWPKEADRVTFVDVGQGDSTIVESMGKVMVIDTGGQLTFDSAPWKERRKASSTADFSVIPLLTERGYDTIDYLLLTHPDQDHFGEAVQLLHHFDINYLIINPVSFGAEKYKETLAAAAENHTKVIDSRRLPAMKLGHAQLHLMNIDSSAGDENDSSIVTFVKLKQLTYLLMADLPADKEQQITSQLSGITVNVLKIGHHGSETSTSDALLDRLKPNYAVISAGRNNRFGHPHSSVIRRLETRGISILNTQRDGKVEFEDNALITGKKAIKKTRQ